MNFKMKKVLAICLMMVMLVTMSVSVFAAPNGFVSSPSTNTAPPVVDFKPSNGSTTITLNVVPYGERHEMEQELLEVFEEAYKTITEAENVTDLTEELKTIVEEKNIEPEKVAISDMFDIHTEGTVTDSGKIEYEITLDLEMLSHFVALLHMKDGKWEVVEDAQVVGDGQHLKFSVDSLSISGKSGNSKSKLSSF